MKKVNIPIDIHQSWKTLISQYVEKRPFTLKDTGVTHRLITYWDEKGLLNEDKNDHKWRKFNLIDLVWIRLIAKLREFNIGLDTILQVKNSLWAKMPLEQVINEKHIKETVIEISNLNGIKVPEGLLDNTTFLDEVKSIEVSWLFVSIAQMYLDKRDMSILIFFYQEGKEKELITVPFSPSKLPDFLKIDGFKEILARSYISISLNDLVTNVFQIADTNSLHDLLLLTKDEKVILEILRSGKYKSVKVRFDKSQKPLLLETTEEKKVNINSRISEFIRAASYQNIEIKTERGKIVSFTNSNKIKLNTGHPGD